MSLPLPQRSPIVLAGSRGFADVCFPPLMIFLFILLIPSVGALSQDSTANHAAATGPDSISLSPVTTATKDYLRGRVMNWNLPPDTGLTPAQIRKRVRLIAGVNIVGYSAAMAGLYAAWYSNYDKTGFHAFNDSREWLQMDKAGHVYSAYAESMASMELWRWTGIERKKRIWLGGMSGAAYQTVIEVLDGFSEGWGWSWADFGANILGSGALVAQELAWDDQRIKFKFSFHRKEYGDPELNQRSDVLFGESSPERFLKDYNGQTYWASINIRSFFQQSNWPPWLSVAIGYGAEGMFGGTANIGKDDDGNINFYRPDIRRYRQWYLSPDIDLSRIKTRKKAVKILLSFLNVFKFPAPSLEFSRGRFSLHAIHF